MRNSIVLLAALCVSACATAPFDYPREASVAIDPDTETTLSGLVDAWRSQHPGPSGFYPLVDGMTALGARIKMIEIAEKSIDAQYFLMKGDTAGQLFAGALYAAAERGVRVRFLLDDIFTTVEDAELELLDAHPNIEVRLYNPVSRRGFSSLNYLGDFRRANRRMHNKSFTVDNQITVVGGRNIANEYFELHPEGEFLDLDVIGFGPVAADVSEAFDRFWNHERALPIAAVSSRFTEDELQAVREEIVRKYTTANESVYETATTTPVLREFANDERELVSASAEVITDDPDKLVNAIDVEQRGLVNRLVEIVGEAENEVIVITPYLIPRNGGVALWRALADRGVRVAVVTNSLASNNHTVVHAGYSKYRKPLIDAGVELYETRANAVAANADGGVTADALTLHTKAILIDRRLVFIGSLNLDPRSIDINSEMGLLIDSPELGEALAEGIEQRLPELAYRVERDERGKLAWRGNIDGVEVVETSEPLASGWKKFTAFLLKIVPEGQL